MQIKNLFDPSKDINRTIEKVITYQASQENRLKAEITEYIVTESIENAFEELLSKMQLAMDHGGENEIGVWVSGFYGSGKSSFTKYLGMALDDSVEIDHVRFLNYLQDRMNKAQTRALLSTVAKRYPVAVVMLDLASEMLAGATMQDISTVLFYKVLQWAGYSQNLKVAALEQRLKKDGRYEEFKERILTEVEETWENVQNDPLVIDSLIPEIAHDMYPSLFRTRESFNTEASDYVKFENNRVAEMIEIVRETTGKDYIIFIIDEVGQYVASRTNLILNLDGLAKNLKHIGNGKVWIMGTAQQTLTEDDPRASLNSPELYKLKDRFPIEIDLEPKDIKEICYRRLLGKSPEGEKMLGELFEKHGPALRFNTKLENAGVYDSDFNKESFVNLYPFLPAHFGILLQLLGSLAKSTGGFGLRSAIKVVQDILIEGIEGQPPVAEQPIGWLATTVTLYDALEKDIRRASPSIHKAVEKTKQRFHNTTIHHQVAKTVAVLQILGNLPVTIQNISSLSHPQIEAPSHIEAIKQAVEEMSADGFVPFGEKDGNLCFFSEKINEIGLERKQIPLRTIEIKRIQNEALREVFNPVPAVRLNGSLLVSSGIKTVSNGAVTSLFGERDTIQTIIEFVDPEAYADKRETYVDESRQRSAENTLFLVSRSSEAVNELLAEIYRCREIAGRYKNDVDQEVKDYCAGQTDRANKLAGELTHVLRNDLRLGSFIFRGQTTAVESLDQNLGEAIKKQLSSVVEQVFDRYQEAPLRAETTLAEKFLRVNNLRAINSSIDPLGLVEVVGGMPRINGSFKALTSIRDYIDRQGTVDGKRLTTHFTDAPFGWSQDTLRYLVAALLVNGELKLKISGKEITVNGQAAIEGLKNNNSFKNVGITLRDGQLSPDVLARAAQRLTEITGDQIIPLEQNISKAVTKYFPQSQIRFSDLVSKMTNLGLLWAEKVRDLNRELADILETDGSDVPQRLGSPESALYTAMTWAEKVDQALKNGLDETIQGLRNHWQGILELPNSGTPGTLRSEAQALLDPIAARLEQDNFYAYAPDLNSVLTEIKKRVQATVEKLQLEQQASIQAARLEISRLYQWGELTNEEQSQVLNQLDNLAVQATTDLQGLKRLINQEYSIQHELGLQKNKIVALGNQRQLDRRIESKEGERYQTTFGVPARMTSIDEIKTVIQTLNQLVDKLQPYQDIEVTIKVKE